MVQRPVDTFPRLLLRNATARPDHPSIREKNLGIWQTWTWAQVAEEVRALASGLAELGFKRGDNLAIIGGNRPRLYWAMAATQCLGGVPVPMYQDSVAQELQFLMQDAQIRFAIVEDQEQVDKLLEIKEQCPRLTRIMYDDPRGMRHYAEPFLGSLDEVQRIGRTHMRDHPGFLEEEVHKGSPDDVAVILYTSGTTGKPKGVCQTHRAFMSAAKISCEFDRLGPEDNVLCYLPLAWGGDHLFSYTVGLYAGLTINCPESGNTVMTDLREIGPTYYFAPPPVFENLRTQMLIRMADASAVKRRMFDYFMEVARHCGADILDRKPSVSPKDRLLYALGNVLVYGPLRNALGFSRIRVAYTAGSAIGPDLFRFYRAIGINLKQFYGLTETCATACLQPDGEIKFDSVGKPAPGVEVRIGESGEVLVRSTTIFKEYYRRPEATAEVIDAEGYFHTGDAGFFDDDGHLKIIDRAKDVGKMANGAIYAPNYVENKLRFFSYVKEAVVFGDGREQVCAFVNIDLDAVGDWAERRNIAYSGYADLSQHGEVYELVRQCVEKVNVELSRDPVLWNLQVHRFLILHKELDPDDDELTRTRKLRRGVIAEKYAVLIEALYSGKTSQFIETQVKFEDGRTGKVSADLRIVEAKVFAPEASKKAA